MKPHDIQGVKQMSKVPQQYQHYNVLKLNGFANNSYSHLLSQKM